MFLDFFSRCQGCKADGDKDDTQPVSIMELPLEGLPIDAPVAGGQVKNPPATALPSPAPTVIPGPSDTANCPQPEGFTESEQEACSGSLSFLVGADRDFLA